MNTHEITELGRRLITGHLAFHGVFAAGTFIEALNFTNNSTAAYIEIPNNRTCLDVTGLRLSRSPAAVLNSSTHLDMDLGSLQT